MRIEIMNSGPKLRPRVPARREPLNGRPIETLNRVCTASREATDREDAIPPGAVSMKLVTGIDCINHHPFYLSGGCFRSKRRPHKDGD
jgi:hypothetical protein